MLDKDTVLWMIQATWIRRDRTAKDFFGLKSPNDYVFLFARLKRDGHSFLWWIWAAMSRIMPRAAEILWKKSEGEEALVADFLAHLFHGKIQNEGFFSVHLHDHYSSERYSERLVVAFDDSGVLVSLYSGFIDFPVCRQCGRGGLTSDQVDVLGL